MCLVSVCPIGTEKNSEKVIAFIRKGASSNTDGSGYMFKRSGEDFITVNKGFFNIDILIQSILENNLTVDDELIIHHRIGTSGLISPENTHPFVLSKLHKECCSTDIKTKKPCIAHNGMFSHLKKYMELDNDFSDTYAFARYILSNENLHQIFHEDEKLFNDLIEDIVGWSKVAIMYSDRPIKMIGEFVENDGYFHSNHGYKSYVYDRGGSSSNNIGFITNRALPAASLFSEGYETDYEIDYEVSNETGELVDINTTPKNWGSDFISKLNQKDKHFFENGLSIIKLDSSFVKINKSNFNHFYYIDKSRYENIKESKNLILRTLDDFNPDTEFQMLSSKQDIDGKPTTITQLDTCPTIKFETSLFFIPKKEFVNVYKELLILISSAPNPGKQTLKKVKRLVENNYNKTNDHPLNYKRLDKPFTKLSLIIFKNYLESKLEIEEAVIYSI